MNSLWRSLPLVAVLAAGVGDVATAAERRTELVRYADVQVEVVAEGNGPAVVLLPSLARDSDDYDQVAEGLAAAGFHVLRPKPRGIGRSTGPMTNITLHDLARDIAEVVEKMGNGRAVIVGHAYGKLDKLVKAWGSPLRAPYMTLSFMALLVIPALKLSDRGLFDGAKFEFTDLLR